MTKIGETPRESVVVRWKSSSQPPPFVEAAKMRTVLLLQLPPSSQANTAGQNCAQPNFRKKNGSQPFVKHRSALLHRSIPILARAVAAPSGNPVSIFASEA
jgi:hypothetical protein